MSFVRLTIFLSHPGAEANSADVEQHLEMGKKMLAAGQFADALSHYHAAVGKDTDA